MFNSLFSFPTFLLFSPFRLVRFILNDKQYYRLKFKYNNSLTNQDQYRQVQQYYRLKFKYNKSLTNQDQYGQVQQYYSQSVYSVHDGLQVQECNQLEEKNAAFDRPIYNF
jgi:hypothetical protein